MVVVLEDSPLPIPHFSPLTRWPAFRSHISAFPTSSRISLTLLGYSTASSQPIYHNERLIKCIILFQERCKQLYYFLLSWACKSFPSLPLYGPRFAMSGPEGELQALVCDEASESKPLSPHPTSLPFAVTVGWIKPHIFKGLMLQGKHWTECSSVLFLIILYFFFLIPSEPQRRHQCLKGKRENT